MIFGIGPGEFIGLAVLAIFFVGPERLPKFSSDAAKFLKKAKNMANDRNSRASRKPRTWF